MSTHTSLTSHPLFSTGRLVIFATAALLAVLGTRWLPGGQPGLWFATAAIAVAIWHGAFDGVLAEEAFQPRFGVRWKLPFYTAYLALGAGVLVLWWVAPVVALLIFLLYSALHFGTEAEPELSPGRLVVGMASGFVPIAAACHWWPQQVASIFRLMLRGSADAATPFAALSGRALWPVVAVVLLGSLCVRGANRLTTAALIAVELLLFRGCPPVAAFALFFCLWHTPEHMLSTSTDRLGTFRGSLLKEHLRRGAVPWLVSLVGVAVACWLGQHEVSSYIGVIFIALSALTVPHMVLAEFCRRQHRSPPRPRTDVFAAQREVIR